MSVIARLGSDVSCACVLGALVLFLDRIGASDRDMATTLFIKGLSASPVLVRVHVLRRCRVARLVHAPRALVGLGCDALSLCGVCIRAPTGVLPSLSHQCGAVRFPRPAWCPPPGGPRHCG